MKRGTETGLPGERNGTMRVPFRGSEQGGSSKGVVDIGGATPMRRMIEDLLLVMPMATTFLIIVTSEENPK